MVYIPWIFTSSHFVYSQLAGKGLAEKWNMWPQECQVYFQQVRRDFPTSGRVPKIQVYGSGPLVSKQILHWTY